MKRRIRNFSWALIFLFPVSMNAQEKVDESPLLPLDKNVRTGKLPNGFTYYIRQNAEPKNRVVLYLANKVGSILETDEQQGLAHFLEHMSFNGTTNFPKNQLIDYLQKAGVRFGADINAYTSFDETVYQLPLPTDNPDIVKNGIQIMRDWAQGLLLEGEEIDKERGVILEEKRTRKGVSERMSNQYLPLLLNNSKYSKRLPIGTDEVLINFKHEAIHEYYNDWYRPNLQALIVVGDINVDDMERTIKDKFSDLKNPANEKERIYYSVELKGENKFISLTDKELTSTVAQVIMKYQSHKMRTEADFNNAMIKSLFNQMLGRRYGELARKPNPDFLQGSAGLDGLMAGLSTFTATASPKPGPGEMEKAFKAVWREIVRAQKFGFTEAEFTRAKINYQTSLESAVQEKDKVQSEGYVKQYLQHFLNDNAAVGIDFENELFKKILPTITLEQINDIVKTYVKATDRDIIIMAPEKEKENLPNEATMLSWMKEVEAEQLVGYQEDINTKPFLNKAPVKGKVVSQKIDKKLNITTLTLSNGIKVLLKPTTYKNNEIIFSAFAPGGTNMYDDNDFQSAANATNIITSFGAGNYSVTELSKYLTGKQAGVKVVMGERSQHVGGSATMKDLPTALELVYAYLTEPRKDTAQYESIITRSKASMANRGDNPGAVFQDSASAILSNYNVRGTGPTVEKLEQISLEKTYQIYKERFGNAAGLTFTFVGSFNVDSIKPVIEQYLGALPTTKKEAKPKDLGITIPKGRIEKTIYKGAEQMATVQLIFSGEFKYDQENMLNLSALKEVLNFRLTERLREEEGGVYTPSISASNSKLPQPRYTVAISFGCSPENVEKLIASALDEIEKVKADGPPQVNIDKWKAETKRESEIAIQTNSWWLKFIDGSLQNGEDLHRILNDTTINKITPQSVKATAQQYLSGKNYIRLVLMPEKDTK